MVRLLMGALERADVEIQVVGTAEFKMEPPEVPECGVVAVATTEPQPTGRGAKDVAARRGGGEAYRSKLRAACSCEGNRLMQVIRGAYTP